MRIVEALGAAGELWGRFTALCLTLAALLAVRDEALWARLWTDASASVGRGENWAVFEGIIALAGQILVLALIALPIAVSVANYRFPDQDVAAQSELCVDCWAAALLAVAGLFMIVTASDAPIYSQLLGLALLGGGAWVGQARFVTRLSTSHRRGSAGPQYTDPEFRRFAEYMAQKMRREREEANEARRYKAGRRRERKRREEEEPFVVEDPFAVLGLKPGCTMKELRSAYLSLSKRWHPDLATPGTQAEAEKAMKKVNAAYRQLLDTLQRANAGEKTE